MTTYERKLRLTVAAVSIAMAITSVVLIVIIFGLSDLNEVLVAGVISALPTLWTAPVLLLAHEGDGVRLPRFRSGVSGAATVVLLGMGMLFVVALVTLIVGTDEMKTALGGVAMIGTGCLGWPAGLVCLSYLVLLVWKRLSREPDLE